MNAIDDLPDSAVAPALALLRRIRRDESYVIDVQGELELALDLSRCGLIELSYGYVPPDEEGFTARIRGKHEHR